MATLWKTATESQYRMLRAIAGAVKNASDAHDMGLAKSFARSVAKRAVGTLTSQWEEVLAAKSQRRQDGLRETRTPRRPRGSEISKEHSKGDRLISLRRSPIRVAWRHVKSTMWKHKNDPAEREMRIRVLKLLHAAQKEVDDFYKQEK